MSAEWGDYEIFAPGVSRPLHEVSRAEAKAAFEHLMTSKEERIAQLMRLLTANGIDLDGSDAAIRKLEGWFRANVTEDGANPGRLQPIWYSVVNDIAIYLGELLIQRRPSLQWTFWDRGGRRELGFQRHVITGFQQIANPKFYFDIDIVLATIAHRLIAGESVPDDYFGSLLRETAEDA